MVVRPLGVHSRFLPLGTHFQEGGTGGPPFSRPQDWPDAIRKNPSMRPRGVRRWDTHTVNLNDLHVYVQLGQMVYGGNRPPGRYDPVEPQRNWKAIEAAFFRGAVLIILQLHLLTEIHGQLTADQRAPYKQPFLATVGDPNQLSTRDVAQHLIRSGATEPWVRLDMVTGYAHAYLRDWARRQPGSLLTTDLGRLFQALYPNGIEHQNDRHFIEDAAAEEETWEESTPVEVPMDEEDDDVPPLEPQTPTEGTPRIVTPEDERLDWGEDD